MIANILLIMVLVFLITKLHWSEEEPPKENKTTSKSKTWEWEKYKYRDFCPNCYLEDYWFEGGGSWSPEMCPICGCTVPVPFETLPDNKKQYAIDLHCEKWKKKYGCYPYKR